MRKEANLPASYQFKDLPRYIQHMAEYQAISIIPLKKGSKTPKNGVKWTKYRGLGKQYPLKRLKRKRGNFGIICGDAVKWGTGYLTILDIDDKKLYPIFKDIDTLHVKTASKGYHLYFWSGKEVKNKDQLGNMFNMNIELRGSPNFYTVLPPSNIILENGSIGHHEVIKEPEGVRSFMEVEDAEQYLKEVIEVAGYKAEGKNPPLTFENGSQRGYEIYTALLQLSKRWERTLEVREIENLVRLLEPFYKEGQRQNMCLWLSGWLLKAEISYVSASKVISQLSRNDSEEERVQRLNTLKNSYRGLDEKSLKGSSGIYELIEAKLQKIHNKDPKKVEKKSKQVFTAVKMILVHPLSILGIQSTLEALKRKFDQEHIKRIHDFLQYRYTIVKDNPTWQHWIYNNQEGVYELYNDDQYQNFLSRSLGEELFTSTASNTLKSMFTSIREESSEYIAFNNCLLELETLKPVKFTADEFITSKIPYDWNPEAEGGLVEKKLQEILIDRKGDSKGEKNKYIQYLQMIGYCIVENRNPRQKMFLLFGDAGTGKTQIIQLIAGLFPGKVASVPLQRFQDQFGLAPLLNKRLNTLYDISREEINDPSTIKAVTGGDSITIDRKYKEAVTYPDGLPVKTIGSGNELPRINDVSKAIFERIITIELKNKFRGTKEEEKDIELYKKLLKEDEGISWLIHKSVMEYKHIKDNNKKFRLEKDVNEMENEYLRVSDPCRYAAQFLFEKSNDEHDFYTRQEIVQMITQQLKTEGLRIPSSNKEYYNAIRSIGGEDYKRKILGDAERGFILLKARDGVPDPAETRLQNQTLIEHIQKIDMQGREIDDMTILEREILGEIMNYVQKFKTTSLKNLLDDLNMEGYSKKQIQKVLEAWKHKGYLKVNNKHYKR